MKRITFLVAAIVGLLALNISAQAPHPPNFSGVVTGRVLDEDGHPVVKARVCASPTIGWIGRIPCSESDSGGKFSIHIWRPAEYAITAEKEKDGYPATDNTFYGSPAFSPVLPRVIMSDDETRHQVTVQLGPPFGRLIGKVVDAETGQTIESVRMELHHANTPANAIRRSKGYRKGRLWMLVPPVPIIFKISAPGYKEWWYGADGSEGGAEALEVGFGSTRELAIPLRPVTKTK
jgi:hypothetical protein